MAKVTIVIEDTDVGITIKAESYPAYDTPVPEGVDPWETYTHAQKAALFAVGHVQQAMEESNFTNPIPDELPTEEAMKTTECDHTMHVTYPGEVTISVGGHTIDPTAGNVSTEDEKWARPCSICVETDAAICQLCDYYSGDDLPEETDIRIEDDGELIELEGETPDETE